MSMNSNVICKIDIIILIYFTIHYWLKYVSPDSNVIALSLPNSSEYVSGDGASKMWFS